MTNNLVDVQINVKIKLSAAWASLVLIYLYADLFAFYVPEHLTEAIEGNMAGIAISPVLLLVFMAFMAIPSLMVFLSLVLRAKENRWTNIIVGFMQLGLVLPSVIGDENIYFIFASSIEVVLLLLIVWYAWKWPTQEGND